MLQIFNRFKQLAQTLAKVNLRSSPSNIEYGLILAVIIGLFMFLFGPSLQAEFYLVEDHYLYSGSLEGLTGWAGRVLIDVQVFQRFRPLYWLYISLGSKLFGANPHLWHMAAILWGVLTCYLLYIALRKIGADIASSLLFVLLLVLSGNQNWIWLNLIPQETLGMLLTAVAVWSIISAAQARDGKPWDISALVAMAMAGLVKESFVILIPALMMLRWTCQKRPDDESWRNTFRRLRIQFIVAALIFAIELALVLAVFLSAPIEFGGARASGLSADNFDVRRWLELCSALSMNRKLILAAGCVFWASLWFDKKISRADLLGGTAIFTAWLVPQFLLYNHSFNERYLFPAVVSTSAAITLGLSIFLHRRYVWPLWFVGVVLIWPLLENGVTSTTARVGAFTADTIASNRVVKFLAHNVPADQAILIAADCNTGYGFEAMYSLPILLKLNGSDSPVYSFPINKKDSHNAARSALCKGVLTYPDRLVPNDAGAVIIVDKWNPEFDTKPLVQWLAGTDMREISFVEPYYSFSPQEFSYAKVGDVSHRILLLASSSVPSGNPLIWVDCALSGVVGVSPLLTTPSWGLENDYAGPGSIVWIGQGDEEGLSGELSSTHMQPVTIVLDMISGPSRTDTRRTIEFSVDNHVGQETQRTILENGPLTFNTVLQPGTNRFHIRVLDPANVLIQPNGDKRRLLALVRRVTIRRAFTDQGHAGQ